MKVVSLLTILTATAAATYSTAQVSAQYARGEGRGDLTRGGARASLDGFELSLSANGDATITLVGSKRWTYTGRWYESGQDNFEIDIRLAYDDANASGRILIDIQNNRVLGFTVDGRAKGDSFHASFRVDRGGELGRDNLGGYDQYGDVSFRRTERGRGDWRIGRDSGRLSDLTVDINRDGTFRVDIPREGAIEGTWTQRASDRLTLRITDAFRDRNAEGSGELILSSRRESYKSLRLNGTSGRDQFSLNFSVGVQDDAETRFTLNKTERGVGTCKMGRSGHEADRTTIDLRRDGRFEVVVTGRETSRFGGTWTAKGNTVELNVDQAFGRTRNVTGSGRIDLSRDRKTFTGMSLRGRESGTDFNASFNVRDIRPNNPGGGTVRPPAVVDTGISFMKDTKGEGRYDYDSARYELRSTAVNVKRDGTFSVSVPTGESTQIISGTYTRSGNRLNLRVTGGFGGGTTGSGSIVLAGDENSFVSVSLDGQWKNKRFTLSFSIR